MKIKIDQPIKEYDGTNAKTGEGAEEKDLTFRMVIEKAINFQSEKYILTAEEKIKAFQIGLKLNAKVLEQYDLTTDQIAFVKQQIGRYYGPVAYGRFLELIGDLKIKPEE